MRRLEQLTHLVQLVAAVLTIAWMGLSLVELHEKRTARKLGLDVSRFDGGGA